MKSGRIAALAGALACAAIAGAAYGAISTASDTSAVIHTEDVTSFHKLYDATGGHPTADQLQNYIDTGSDGLHLFAKVRRITGARIADAIAKRPEFYSNARTCMAALPRVRVRLAAALRKFRRLYPEMVNEPVTITVGRTKPVGVADASGVMIGLEAMLLQ